MLKYASQSFMVLPAGAGDHQQQHTATMLPLMQTLARLAAAAAPSYVASHGLPQQPPPPVAFTAPHLQSPSTSGAAPGLQMPASMGHVPHIVLANGSGSPASAPWATTGSSFLQNLHALQHLGMPPAAAVVAKPAASTAGLTVAPPVPVQPPAGCAVVQTGAAPAAAVSAEAVQPSSTPACPAPASAALTPSVCNAGDGVQQQQQEEQPLPQQDSVLDGQSHAAAVAELPTAGQEAAAR